MEDDQKVTSRAENEMIKLKKCVCYSKPRTRKSKDVYGHVEWLVECSCGRRTDDEFESKDKAIARWNEQMTAEKGEAR